MSHSNKNRNLPAPEIVPGALSGRLVFLILS